MNHNVLIVEDDPDIIELLTLYLESQHFVVFSAGDGEEALEVFSRKSITVLLVDLMLPKMNGYELLKQIRKTSDVPVIIISAKNMDSDRILGLDLGADAYITKPFNSLEVVAYVKALCRRYEAALSKEQPEEKKLVVGDLQFDLEKYLLKKQERTVPLTSSELKIVAAMMRSPGKVFTKTELYECINGQFYESDDNTMMVHISNIRAKIEADPVNPAYIQTVRGLGYKIEEPKTSKS